MFRTFGVRTLPAVALNGADGRLVRVLDRGTPDLAAALRRALAGS